MIHVSEADSDEEDSVEHFEPRTIVVKNKDPKTEYTMKKELGRGKFGIVYRCVSKEKNREFAAKYVKTTNKQDRDDVVRELNIMKALQHVRLLQLYDAFDDMKAEMCLILELIEGGELFERVICDDFVLTEKSCVVFTREICQGAEYMHSKNIIHLDLKPENILCVTRTGNRIKIIDFGLARHYDPNEKLQVLFGTPEFVAPEVVNYDKVGPTTDTWSIGVITYILLSGLSPFMGESDLETMANVTGINWDFEDEAFDVISEEALDFISKLLVKDKNERMTATQCLNHPWLKKTRKASLDHVLDKRNLRRFVIRRRWQKAVNAILALKRMGATLSL